MFVCISILTLSSCTHIFFFRLSSTSSSGYSYRLRGSLYLTIQRISIQSLSHRTVRLLPIAFVNYSCLNLFRTYFSGGFRSAASHSALSLTAYRCCSVSPSRWAHKRNWGRSVYAILSVHVDKQAPSSLSLHPCDCFSWCFSGFSQKRASNDSANNETSATAAAVNLINFQQYFCLPAAINSCENGFSLCGSDSEVDVKCIFGITFWESEKATNDQKQM